MSKPSPRRNLKRKVFELLETEDFTRGLEILCSLPARQVVNPLFSFLCSLNPEIRWRAVTAIGAVVANLAQKEMESARVVMRRMIWNLNDESGGIGWGSPEAMGESLARHQGLACEYTSILVSYIRQDGNFLEHEPLQQGVLWGLSRLAEVWPELLQDAVPHLRPFLTSRDPVLRALALRTLGLLGAAPDSVALADLKGDDTEISIYQDGVQRTFQLSEIAEEARERSGV
jgi:hypothetical protein